MSEDRLRIKTMSGCDYKKSNVGCDFCNNSNVCTYFEAIDIFESIQHASEIYQHKIRHFLIGGGTDFRNNYWDIVEQVVNFIHSNSELPNEITLMAAPFQKKQLKKIKQWGISDLSINIEIYDDNLAKKIMRGKRIDRNKYFELFKEAKNLWPQYGDVRSMVIVGLDTTQNLIKLITELIEIGVQPVLSIFRPLPNTPLEYNTMPSNEYLENIYYICNRICKEKNSEYSLGPKCVACKNNILAL